MTSGEQPDWEVWTGAHAVVVRTGAAVAAAADGPGERRLQRTHRSAVSGRSRTRSPDFGTGRFGRTALRARFRRRGRRGRRARGGTGAGPPRAARVADSG